MSTSVPEFETLAVSQPAEYVYHVELNRPEKRNAMNDKFWRFLLLIIDCISIFLSHVQRDAEMFLVLGLRKRLS